MIKIEVKLVAQKLLVCKTRFFVAWNTLEEFHIKEDVASGMRGIRRAPRPWYLYEETRDPSLGHDWHVKFQVDNSY